MSVPGNNNDRDRNRDLGKRRRHSGEAVELYRLARVEELRHLEAQHAEMDSMRQRSATFLAFVGSATAFLVGTGLGAASRDASFYVLATLASVMSLVAVVAALAVFLGGWAGFPFRVAKYRFTLKSGVLLRIIESDLGTNETQLNDRLARMYGEMTSYNLDSLARMRVTYVVFLLTGAVQVVAWASLVWAKA